MGKTHESELAGCEPAAAPWDEPEGDGLRRLTYALLAVYLAPVVLLVLVLGGVMVVLVKAVELVAGAARFVRASRPGASWLPEGAPRWWRPRAVPALRVSGRTGSGPGSPR
jgi:hypothetical protein